MSPSASTRVVLATASPRRRRLFQWLGLPFEITSIDTPEDMDTPLAADPQGLAEHLAAEKAAALLARGDANDALVLCFDTIVVHNGAVLGKPVDVDDAWRMLRSLSGCSHQVVTGVALLKTAQETVRKCSVTTEVRMKTLADDDIRTWMARGEFMGCAGAYNIEAQVAQVDADECFHNVAGMPLCHL
ncbi:MAG: Maf family protein, partial [Actinomycetota bacterium]|nr:Maf family protein [Actinomycetota bacterium]